MKFFKTLLIVVTLLGSLSAMSKPVEINALYTSRNGIQFLVLANGVFINGGGYRGLFLPLIAVYPNGKHPGRTVYGEDGNNFTVTLQPDGTISMGTMESTYAVLKSTNIPVRLTSRQGIEFLVFKTGVLINGKGYNNEFLPLYAVYPNGKHPGRTVYGKDGDNFTVTLQPDGNVTMGNGSNLYEIIKRTPIKAEVNVICDDIFG